jgi:hypothetical protein
MTTTGMCYSYPRVITEIRINKHVAREKPDNMTHVGLEAPRVATIHDVTNNRVRSYLPLVSSSTPMRRRTPHGWPEHYPIVPPWSEVRFCPTRRHTKLLTLGIPYVQYAPVHNFNLLTRARQSVLNRLRRGQPSWSSEYQIRPLPFLPIQHSPISPNCPARSPFMPTIRSSC